MQSAPIAETKSPEQVRRTLVRKGFSTDEAIEITATTFGIPVQTSSGKQVHWTIKQINNLLFLADQISKGVFKS